MTMCDAPIGGGRALTSLADIALSPEMLKITMVVIVLDLSKPSRVISDLMFWINLLRYSIPPHACIHVIV